MDRSEALAQRMATQRLTTSPFVDAADAVRALLCVQAQDAPFARYSLTLRCLGGDAAVRAAIDEGRIVRTHILRPTWHFVAAEDLRWLQALVAPKVLQGLRGRHARLGLDDRARQRGLDVLTTELRGRQLTRGELAPALFEAGLPRDNSAVSHMLLVAELQSVVCSGALRGREHTYALVDEWIAPTPRLDREVAMRWLVGRFFAGHGPADVKDLTRWAALTQAEIKLALRDLPQLVPLEVDGLELWHDPASPAQAGPQLRSPDSVFLLPVFDEAFLTYPRTGFQRAPGHPSGTAVERFAESSTGVVIAGRRDVGTWRRRLTRGRGETRLELTDTLSLGLRAQIAEQSQAVAQFGLD